MRLYNAHRPVFLRKSVPHKTFLRLKRSPSGWGKLLSDDVVKYVKDLKHNDLAGTMVEQKLRVRKLVKSPAHFFARQMNVPLEMRKQIYMPDFVVTLIRTKHLPPKFASFYVPLWFNKLDFKNYLKNVYDVDVLHIRSYVAQQKVEREKFEKGGKTIRGALFRPLAKKKMTVELLDPFIYPEEETDLAPWDTETYRRELKEQCVANEEESPQAELKENKPERESIAEQARQLLMGGRKWKPTWQSIPADTRVLQNTTRPPGIRSSTI